MLTKSTLCNFALTGALYIMLLFCRYSSRWHFECSLSAGRHTDVRTVALIRYYIINAYIALLSKISFLQNCSSVRRIVWKSLKWPLEVWEAQQPPENVDVVSHPQTQHPELSLSDLIYPLTDTPFQLLLH